MDDSSNKRKRELEDHGDREQKKVHVEDRRISIKDLHLDVGQKYLLCRTRKTPFYGYSISPPGQAWFAPEPLHFISSRSIWLT